MKKIHTEPTLSNIKSNKWILTILNNHWSFWAKQHLRYGIVVLLFARTTQTFPKTFQRFLRLLCAFFCCVHSFVSFNVLFFLRYARRCIMWLKTVCSHATCIQWCQEEKNYPFRLIFTHIEMNEKKTSTTFSTLNEIYFPKKKSYHININRT